MKLSQTSVAIGAVLIFSSSSALERISINDSIGPGNGNSQHISVSADGNRIAFESFSSQLVAGDSKGERDIFDFDRADGSITRISVGPMGVEANDASRAPAISGNGRFVAFTSDADNLVVGDTNGNRDLFVHDLETGTTTIESVATGGGIVSDAESIFYECDIAKAAFSEPCHRLQPSVERCKIRSFSPFLHQVADLPF